MSELDFETACIELIPKLPKLRSRHCFSSAFNHLKKSKLLFGVDNEMSTFRALTAEEEASTGLMLCLKERHYQNSNKLKYQDHAFKVAIPFFLQSIKKNFVDFQEIDGFEYTLSLDDAASPPRLSLKIGNDRLFPGHTMSPVPPLHFFSTIGTTLRSFRSDIKEQLVKADAQNALTYLKDAAQFRNKLLYASDKGYLVMPQPPEMFYAAKRNSVITLYYLYLLIQPYKEHQGFVQQCLDSLLAMLESIPLGDLHAEV